MEPVPVSSPSIWSPQSGLGCLLDALHDCDCKKAQGQIPDQIKVQLIMVEGWPKSRALVQLSLPGGGEL